MKPAIGSILLAGLGACSGALTSPPRFATSGGLSGDIMVPIRSVEEVRYTGIVRQRFDFSCGSASLATLLRYHYHRPVGEKETFLGMWRDGDRAAIRRVGFSLLDMKRYLASEGLRADGFKVSLDQIRKANLPGIALITVSGYRHFVVVKGVTETEVLVGDPSTGLRAMDRPAFETVWNGVYFVLNSEQDRGRAAFNTGLQWASLPRAPLGNGFVDPLSQQALALSAPFYRDF
jgi:uncharacterized protein